MARNCRTVNSMTFDIFKTCVDLIKLWRDKSGKQSYEWPDSRDPEFQPFLEEAKVVSQDLEKSMVALAAWREGRSEIYQGMSSIVHLLRNRQDKGMFRSHLTDEDQFPSMSKPEDPRLQEYPEKEPEFEKILSNLDDILQKRTIDITQGSIWFGVVGENMEEWLRKVINDPENTRITKIGNLVYYKPKEKK